MYPRSVGARSSTPREYMQEAFDQKLYCSVGRPLVTPIGEHSSFYRVGNDQFLFQAGHRSLILTREELLDLNPDRKVYLENISPIFEPLAKGDGTAEKVASEEDQRWLEAYLEYQEALRQERRREKALAKQQQEERSRQEELARQDYLAYMAAKKRLREERQAEIDETKRRMSKIASAPDIIEKTEADKEAIQRLLRDQSEERKQDPPFWLDPARQWAD